MDGAKLLFFFSGHTHDRQRIAVALNKTIQLQAECFGIEPVGLYSLIALIQLLRADHVVVDRERAELSLQRKTKAARLINRMHLCAALFLESARPMQERFFLETLRRLGIAPAHLFDHHVKILVHINSKLDRSGAAIKLAAGSLV